MSTSQKLTLKFCFFEQSFSNAAPQLVLSATRPLLQRWHICQTKQRMCEKLVLFFILLQRGGRCSSTPVVTVSHVILFKWDANFSAVGLNAWKWTWWFVWQTVYHRRALCYWFHIIPSISHPALFSTPPLYVTPSVPNQNDRQTLCRERQKEWKRRAEILSPLRLCVENSFGGCEHPWKSFLYIQTLIHPHLHLWWVEWCIVWRENAVMSEIFPSYLKLTYILKYNYWATWKPQHVFSVYISFAAASSH